jgi:hypothetical protein
MRKSHLLAAVIVMTLLGAFIAPPYSYTFEEKHFLKEKPRKWDYLYWPVRAYENWQNCGTIRFCRETRCAALVGGCDPTPYEIYFAPKQKRRETAEEWQSRVQKWCAASKPAYDKWIADRQRRKELCESSGRVEAQKNAPKPVANAPPTKEKSQTGAVATLPNLPRIDAGTLVRGYCAQPELFASRTRQPNISDLAKDYETHCR